MKTKDEHGSAEFVPFKLCGSLFGGYAHLVSCHERRDTAEGPLQSSLQNANMSPRWLLRQPLRSLDSRNKARMSMKTKDEHGSAEFVPFKLCGSLFEGYAHLVSCQKCRDTAEGPLQSSLQNANMSPHWLLRQPLRKLKSRNEAGMSMKTKVRCLKRCG